MPINPISRSRLSLCVVFLFALVSCGESKRSQEAATVAGEQTKSQQQEPGVSVKLMPERPTSAECLHAATFGVTNRGVYRWYVNGQLIPGHGGARLCHDYFKKGDQVEVAIGAEELVAKASVVIANTPPRITGISATPEQVFSDSDIQVAPVAEDKDGDTVEFRYQWLINGEVDSFATENTLTADRFGKGDVIQVKVVPFDGTDEGPVYESFTMTIPNSPPRIDSQPPQQFKALEYNYQVKASDADGDSLAWRLDKAPAGMTINPVNGLISWSLAGVKPGAYPMKIVVRDPDGDEAFQEFTLTLGAPAQTPAAK